MAKTGSNIYKRKDGRYEGRILKGKEPGQRARYVYVYARTLRELKQKMRQAKDRQPGSPLVGQMALMWQEARKGRWKQTTRDAYQRLVARYILPILGQRRVAEIDGAALAYFLQEARRLSGKGALSEGYQKYLCGLLIRILAFAAKRENLQLCLPQPPALRGDGRRVRLPEEADIRRLEAWLWGHAKEETCLGILVALYTGLRIGELCALRWKDLDLEGGSLTVRGNLQRVKTAEGEAGGRTKVRIQAPKTGSSVRVVPLAEVLLEVLRENCREPESYLIPGRRGGFTEARTVQYRFAALLKKCRIERFRFHLLRHIFASRCMRSGADVKSLSEVLGHSSAQVTMRIYVHATMEQKRDMVNAICEREGF